MHKFAVTKEKGLPEKIKVKHKKGNPEKVNVGF